MILWTPLPVRMWSSCKRTMRERTVHSRLFDTYLPEYMWRRKFGGPVAFGKNIIHVAEQYMYPV